MKNNVKAHNKLRSAFLISLFTALNVFVSAFSLLAQANSRDELAKEIANYQRIKAEYTRRCVRRQGLRQQFNAQHSGLCDGIKKMLEQYAAYIREKDSRLSQSEQFQLPRGLHRVLFDQRPRNGVNCDYCGTEYARLGGEGETNSSLNKVRVFGVDERVSLTPAEQEQFAFIGIIVCDGSQIGNAFFVGNNKTLVTAAHVVERSYGVTHKIEDCKFYIQNPKDKTVQVINITGIFTPSSRAPGGDDLSSDYAVIKLQNGPNFGFVIPDVSTISVGSISVVGNHINQRNNLFLKSKSSCSYFKANSSLNILSANKDKLSDLDSMIGYSCDTNGGGSGMPIIQNGKIVGLHRGALSKYTGKYSEDSTDKPQDFYTFSERDNFNKGILFSKGLVGLILQNL